MASDLLDMSVELTKGYLNQNEISKDELPAFIRSIHETLSDLRSAGSKPPTTAVTPASPEAAPVAPVAQADTPAVPAATPAAPAAQAPAPVSDTAPNAVPPTAAAQPKKRGPKPGFKRVKKEKPAETHDAASARVRSEDISDPRYKDIDPWLAMRISPALAGKLNPKNKVHPTIFDDRLVCLEDGSEVKLLRSYVKKHFGLDFHQYMAKWHLPSDYPTAPADYINNKRSIAKKTGLGVTLRANRNKRAAAAPAATPAKTAKAKPGPKPGTRRTKKEIQAEQASTEKAAGARGARRQISLFDGNGKSAEKAAEPSMAN